MILEVSKQIAEEIHSRLLKECKELTDEACTDCKLKTEDGLCYISILGAEIVAENILEAKKGEYRK